ncbi:MAG: ATP-binding protein [Flavobacteriales bacterium]|nr:ATP-binding protein [Flavobacteriales bacterium]
MYLRRNLESELQKYLKIFPIVAILGPRQCGKSTLVKQLLTTESNVIYLDLQNLEDLNKLQDPRLFFKTNSSKTICLDEIQLVPELFSVLRSIVDEDRQNGKFILLGSASRDLVQKSSESLAGRIGYLNLTPFQIDEIPTIVDLNTFWNRGGFPDSVLSENDEFSSIWRENFLKTYVERDLPQLGFQTPALQLRRFLTMCAHNQGQLLNLSKLGSSMDLTHPSIRKYIDIFEQTFILRSLPPFEINVKKRMVKSPKIYVRDSGLLHQLLGIKNNEALFGHPVFGSSWEGLVIEQLLSALECPAYFFRTATGDELDLVIELNGKILAIECKASTAPQPTKGFYRALELLQPYHTFIVAPINSESYQLQEKISVCRLKDVLKQLKSY